MDSNGSSFESHKFKGNCQGRSPLGNVNVHRIFAEFKLQKGAFNYALYLDIRRYKRK